MIKNINTLQIINQFLDKYYPEVKGVLLFGSASFTKSDYQDVDLLITDERFSYVSKSEIYFNNNTFSVIKIPTDDLFNVLAQDYKVGVYRNIFAMGFIIKDDLKYLKVIKQYINKDYPDTNQLIAYNINKCTFKINESVKSLKKKLPQIENFLIFSNCIGFLIDFIILQDGKTNFTTHKHKSKYLHQYHLQEAFILNEIIATNKKSSKEALLKIEGLIQQLNISQTNNYFNDFLIENSDNLNALVIYIPRIISEELYSIFYKDLLVLNIQFYSFFVDENNVEESGLYIIIRSVKIETKSDIKKKLTNYMEDKVFFFPYNLAFNQEIKFGGCSNYKVSEELFINIQPIINSIKDEKNTYFQFILFIIENMNISLEKIDLYYFYKTINHSHHLSMKDIVDKEKTHKINMRKRQGKALLTHDKITFDIDFNFSLLDKISQYFLLQIFDRILSMFFLKDVEKRQIIQLLRNQNLTNV